MNVRIKKTFVFSAGVVYNTEFSVNHYTVVLHMTTATSNGDRQNTAYERIEHWIDYIIGNSILISHNDPQLSHWINTEQRLILFPTEPIDQLIGIALYQKFTAITEGEFIINELELSSVNGSEMVYLHSRNETFDGPLVKDGWWNDPKPTWVNKYKRKSRGNVITLDRIPEWKDLDLDFDREGDESGNSVVFVDFNKNEAE